MARENQGLQIALIVFVMLTIVLGVTTYLFYRQADEANKKAEQVSGQLNQKSMEAQKAGDDADDLKKLIVGSKGDKVDALKDVFNGDMQKYGAAFAEGDRAYHPLLEKIGKALQDKTDALAAAKLEIQNWKDKYAAREAGKQKEIDTLAKNAEDAKNNLLAEQAKFKEETDLLRKSETKIRADLTAAQKESRAAMDKAAAKVQEVNDKFQKLTRHYLDKADELNRMTSPTFETALGEVRWVNQRTGTAWINLGRADGLTRQVSFGVYPANADDLADSAEKASLEVTQILGDHLAEARVVDDKMDDPIMPGDKIYTPIWSPGEHRHFAVTGIIDLDGDGRSDLATLLNLITLNGGVVDCYLDDKGGVSGQLSINTRFLVCGAEPSESQSAMSSGNKKIINNAARMGIQSIPLQSLLQRMGWQNTTPVVRYGRGMNPRDFRVKPDEGVQKKSNGNIFTPREPPRKSPTSAY